MIQYIFLYAALGHAGFHVSELAVAHYIKLPALLFKLIHDLGHAVIYLSLFLDHGPVLIFKADLAEPCHFLLRASRKEYVPYLTHGLSEGCLSEILRRIGIAQIRVFLYGQIPGSGNDLRSIPERPVHIKDHSIVHIQAVPFI